jgi:hypothetical protein
MRIIKTLLAMLGLSCLATAKKENEIKSNVFNMALRQSDLYACPFSSNSGIDIYQVMRARRKIHSGKMYRRFRGQRLTGKLARRYGYAK